VGAVGSSSSSPDAQTANAAGGSPLTAMLASGDHGTVEMESPLPRLAGFLRFPTQFLIEPPAYRYRHYQLLALGRPTLGGFPALVRAIFKSDKLSF